MNFFRKMLSRFAKTDEQPSPQVNQPPRIWGRVERVITPVSPNCYHEWREIRGPSAEWNESRYGKAFQVEFPGSMFAHYRNAYFCPLCGAEFVTDDFSMA